MIIQNFKYSREELDLKQKDIAEMFGVHFTTVSGWETGKDTIPIERLVDYANRFHYSLDYLFGLTRHNEVAVIEITEKSELDENDYREFKKRLEKIGVQTAIDDYGTGYSNVQNLLRYMPDYVKI